MQFCPGRTAITAVALAIATAPALGQTTSAQSWPSRVPTIVVSFPAGGPTDVLARAVATDLADRLGQQFVVENRSGAGGNVGAASVAKAAADGYTLLFATTSVVNNRFMYRTVTFDADRDFVPIVLISKTPIVLVAAAATGLKDLAALIARAKADPGKLNLGTPGHGTAAHITAEMLQRLAGFKLTHVPYRGVGANDRRSPGQSDRRRVRSPPDPGPAAQGRQICGHRHHRRDALRRAARSSDRGGERLSGLRGDVVERVAGARRDAARRHRQGQRRRERLSQERQGQGGSRQVRDAGGRRNAAGFHHLNAEMFKGIFGLDLVHV